MWTKYEHAAIYVILSPGCPNFPDARSPSQHPLYHTIEVSCLLDPDLLDLSPHLPPSFAPVFFPAGVGRTCLPDARVTWGRGDSLGAGVGNRRESSKTMLVYPSRGNEIYINFCSRRENNRRRRRPLLLPPPLSLSFALSPYINPSFNRHTEPSVDSFVFRMLHARPLIQWNRAPLSRIVRLNRTTFQEDVSATLYVRRGSFSRDEQKNSVGVLHRVIFSMKLEQGVASWNLWINGGGSLGDGCLVINRYHLRGTSKCWLVHWQLSAEA